MKKFIPIILSSIMMFTSGVNVFANDVSLDKAIEIKEAKKNTIQPPQNISVDKNIIIKIDNQQLNIKDSAVVYENRVYLPVRELAQALRLQLDYNSEQKITTLNNGDIQLPINQNKAVVKGQIVPIDKENDKVGTIVVNDKTYLPLRFISENLGYFVDYSASAKIVNIITDGKVDVNPSESFETITQEIKETKLSLEEAKKLYSDCVETVKNYKNVTITKHYGYSTNFENGSMSSSSDGEVLLDIKTQPSLYIKEKTTSQITNKSNKSLDTEKITQNMFYKDGFLYVDQNVDGENYKYKSEVDSNFNIEDVTTPDSLLSLQDFIIGGSILQYKDASEYVLYSFDLDKTKTKDLVIESLEYLGLYEEDLEGIKDIQIENIHLSISIDDENKPTLFDLSYTINLKNENDEVKISSMFLNNYININTTKVTIPNEDLTKYEELD